MVRRCLAAALAFAVVATACGAPASGGQAGGGGSASGRDLPTANPSPRDDVFPDRTDGCHLDPESPPAQDPARLDKDTPGYLCPYRGRTPYSYRLVRPRPGMDDIKPVPWNGVEVSNGGRTLMLLFVSGVEPCYVLDHVAVEEDANQVTITLYEGSDPAHPGASCIEIAVNKAVRVGLSAPLGTREVVDGADG